MSSNHSNQFINARSLFGAAVLVGVGGVLATLGMTLGSAAVIGAVRRWQQRTEMTPAQLARHAFDSAQAARTAGVAAWRAPMPTGARRPSSTDGAVTPVM
jgi:hypothetical protein